MRHSSPPASAPAFSFDEYKHRYAAWAASRAASTISCRFKVEVGVAIIDAAGLRQKLGRVEALPSAAQAMAEQRALREAIIDAASAHGLAFSHGIAAKLLGMYVKGYLLDHTNAFHDAVIELHPPLDSQMLEQLVAAEVGDLDLWRNLQKTKWTNFDCEQFEAAVLDLRRILGPCVPLWQAERYWPGFRR